MILALHTQQLRRLLWLGLLSLPLGACSALGQLGSERFTFEGELPANFSLKAQAHYGAVEPGCEIPRRQLTQSFESGFQDRAQHYSFAIPVSYRVGLCEVRLARVGLFIKGRYGDKDWQQTYDNGSLVIVDQLPARAPGFQADGSLTKQAQCTWWFQISVLRLELEKLLNCKGAGAYLVRDELPGKTVRLNFAVNPEEEPSHDDTWIRFPTGWKPCLPKEGWQRCQNPPVFKTFQMNGRECTVYPNCTE